MKKQQKQHTKILNNYLKNSEYSFTKQREIILNEFVKLPSHISSEEVYKIIKKKYPEIGRATIYRTLRLFANIGIANKVTLEDGISRFEYKPEKEHHDHLKCTKCGKIIEFVEPKIELLQQKIVKQKRFIPLWHRLEIYGLCKRCMPNN